MKTTLTIKHAVDIDLAAGSKGAIIHFYDNDDFTDIKAVTLSSLVNSYISSAELINDTPEEIARMIKDMETQAGKLRKLIE